MLSNCAADRDLRSGNDQRLRVAHQDAYAAGPGWGLRKSVAAQQPEQSRHADQQQRNSRAVHGPSIIAALDPRP
jgi:hypothetical protein